MAVVRLVIKVAIPILVVTRCKAFTLLWCFLYSWWYLLVKKMQFGIPITIINVGTKAVKTVISYPNNPSVPNDHATPISTITKEIKVALKLRKKK